MILTSLKKVKLTKDALRNVQKEPGVYIFWNEKQTPLYVGKSVSLRSRLSSYLSFPLEPKTKKMISQALYFSTIRVESELEALLLEAKLVRSFNPQYNIQLKDDKHPLYIRITKDEYPMVLTARKIDATNKNKLNKAVYGPFPSSRNVKSVLKMIRRTVPFTQHLPEKRPCIYNQMGLCDPCPSQIEYDKNDANKNILKKEYKKNIQVIKNILDGNLVSVRKDLDKKMRAYSKQQKYEEAKEIRTKIERLDYITQPITNPYEFLKNPNLLSDIRKKETTQLKEFLREVFPDLNKLIRIECYDIAHLAGESPTASMVTFINGEANKNLYRRFKIYQKNGKNDYASLKEVASRRIKHLGDWGAPDLIVVDGGKGQVNMFHDVFSTTKIPVIGLAKRLETVVVPQIGKNNKFWEKRPNEGDALHLLQRLRDESHRFTRTYHHKLIEKQLLPQNLKT